MCEFFVNYTSPTQFNNHIHRNFWVHKSSKPTGCENRILNLQSHKKSIQLVQKIVLPIVHTRQSY